jgi:hypothetical protein
MPSSREEVRNIPEFAVTSTIYGYYSGVHEKTKRGKW